MFQWSKLEKKIETQTNDNAKLMARNQAMEASIMEYKRGNKALEEKAREDLGMIKEGEVYYQFVD